MDKKNRPKLKQLIKLFEIKNEAEGKSPKTIAWYNYILHTFARYFIKQYRTTGQIMTFNIDNFRQYILYLKNIKCFAQHPNTSTQNKTLSDKTIQGHVRGLKAFSTFLYQEGYFKKNALENLKIPQATSKVIEPLIPAEQEKILLTAKNSQRNGLRNHAIIVTLLDTGLRVSELANCKY